MNRFAPLWLAALLAACSTDPAAVPTQDAAADQRADLAVEAPGPADAAPDIALDASPDAAADVVTDVATDVADGGDAPAQDAGMLDGSTAILGTLRGTCGTARAMLGSPSPSLLRNTLTFMAPEAYVRDALSPHGQRIYDTRNAGGSSTESEVMSMEVLHYCEGASLLRTETEVRYQPADDSGANSITDILVEIDGMRVGVSVTRVYRPRPMVLADTDVRALLETKLAGINRSSMRVLPVDRWVKQVLHVFVVDDTVAAQVERAWAAISPALRADTIVVVTVTPGGGFIYCNPDPALGMECPALAM